MGKRKMRLSDIKNWGNRIGIGTKLHCTKHRWCKGYLADLSDVYDDPNQALDCGCPAENIIVDKLVWGEGCKPSP